MTRIHTIILVSYIILLLVAFGTIATQETATASASTGTTTAAVPIMALESSNETTYYGDMTGDRMVRIASAEYVDGTAVLVLELDPPRTATVTAPTGSTSTGVAARNLTRRPTPLGRTTIRIDSPEPRAALVMSYFIENGRYTEIRLDDSGSALITGPFTGTDVRDAAIGGVFGTSFGALLIIVRQRLDLHRDIECVA